jgi:predicted nucleic acid-binding protein
MVGVDTNLIVYAEGIGDDVRVEISRDVLLEIPRRQIVIPAQVLAETFRVLRRKLKLAPDVLRQAMGRWETFGFVAPTMETTIETALDIATEHRLQVFDAIILAASAEAGCRMLLSEDMQDGFVWAGVTVVNPFAETVHPLLADLLRH